MRFFTVLGAKLTTGFRCWESWRGSGKSLSFPRKFGADGERLNGNLCRISGRCGRLSFARPNCNRVNERAANAYDWSGRLGERCSQGGTQAFAQSCQWLRKNCIVPKPAVICLCLLSMVPGIGYTDPLPVDTPPIDAAFERLILRLSQHPLVISLRHQAGSMEAAAAGARGLPNPDIAFGVANVPLRSPTQFDRFAATSKTVGISQKIPSPTGRQARQMVGDARAELARAKALLELSRLKFKLIRSLAQRQRIRTSLAALDRQLGLFNELEKWLKGEMESGRAVYGRFEELNTRRGRIRERKLALEGEDGRWRAALWTLVQEDSLVAPPNLMPFPWSEQVEELLPLQVAERQLDIAKAQVKERKSRFLPDYGISATYQQRDNDGPVSGDDWYTIRATISIPLWAKDNQNPKLAAAQLATMEAQAVRSLVLLEAREGYDTAVINHETALRLLKALDRRRGELFRLEEANRRRYESGEISLESVIDPALERAKIDMEKATQRAQAIIAAADANAKFKRFVVSSPSAESGVSE